MRLIHVLTRRALPVLLALALPAAALAGVPQTIVVDGVNDFDALNLLDADGADTQHPQIDIGDFYVTNDAVNLFVGFDHDKESWGQVQLGIAIDVGTADGGTADPWGRQLEWSLAAFKPDFMFYVNLDNNWQHGMYWDGAGWAALSAPGTNSLGWIGGGGFSELAIQLAALGVSAGSTINVEAWVTQDSATKGPLDAVANDASQLSTPGSTIWETTTPIPMFDYIAYTVQAASDSEPPLLLSARHDNPGVVDVTFSEPVGAATAEDPANYAVTGATVVAAQRDAANQALVHLTLAADIGASDTMYTVDVSGVQDLAGNTMAADAACFAIENVLFRGRMSQFLAGQAEPYQGFTVEGGALPLTWSLCDGMDGADMGDGVYEASADFCLPGDCDTGEATLSVEWKWVYGCSTYEPLSNRMLDLSLADGSSTVVDVWWNDLDPTQFTAHDIDVFFYADLNVYGYALDDTVAINGSIAPLTYDVPSLNLLADDGSGADDMAGDGIFSAKITFPAGSLKNVVYKFLLNDAYECFGQGDRNLFLNDEMFDVEGGPLGPLVLPVVHYDRCTTIWRDVTVIFSVDASLSATPQDTLGVNGTPHNSETPSFSWDIPSLNTLRDDGVAPDEFAGDGIYTLAVLFPDSSNIDTEYKYLLNGVYECADDGNRSFSIDADNHSTANPQVLETVVFDVCGTGVGVGDSDIPSQLVLPQNRPNPFNPQTEIAFTVHRAGWGTLRVYDVKGNLVRTLVDGHQVVGSHAVTWDGRDDAGRQAPSGVYVYRLQVNDQVGSRKMLLVK
jgi:hypothetical protein